MNKKTKCKNCSTEFIPTAAAPNCPKCGVSLETSTATAHAAFLSAQPLSVPDDIAAEVDWQWMPPGYQEPVCFVSGKPKQLKFTVQAKHAEIFNSQLQNFLTKARAGRGDKPMTDYDHADAAASSRPVRMYWGGNDPITGGIRLVTKPTSKARAGIKDGEWDRFSPEWDFDPETFEPISIGTNLGGLVNKAAFKTIAPVVAKDAGAANHKHIDNMDKNEMTSVITDALKPFGDRLAALETKFTAQPAAATAQAKSADEIKTVITDLLKPVTDEITALKTAGVETKKAQAKAGVAKYVGRAGLAPQDTKAIEFWEAAYLANPVQTEELLGKLPKAQAAGVRITSGHGGTQTITTEFSEPENRILDGAKKLREGNKAIASDASAIEAYLRSPEGNAAYAEILAGRDPNGKRTDIARAN